MSEMSRLGARASITQMRLHVIVPGVSQSLEVPGMLRNVAAARRSRRTQAPGLYDRPCLDRALAALESAEQTGKVDPAVARRVAAVARTFRYGYWMIEWLEQLANMEVTGDGTRLAAAAAAGRKAMTYSEVPDGAVPALGVFNRGFGKEEARAGRLCWNADETGPGDRANGWAEFFVPVADRTRPFVLELDVWGESALFTIGIDASGGWKKIAPSQPISGKPQWDTLRFQVAPDQLAPDQASQHFGLGGGDSQVRIAAIRVGGDKPQAGEPATGTFRTRTRQIEIPVEEQP